MQLRRLFWIGAAGLLGLAALISIVALLRGEVTPTDGNILFTLGAAFLAGSSALAGLALIERRDLVPLGLTVVAVASPDSPCSRGRSGSSSTTTTWDSTRLPSSSRR